MNLDIEELFTSPDIAVKKSKLHRWGVFAKADIKKHDVLQESPYCTFDEWEVEESDVIYRYCYGTDGQGDIGDYVIGFGYASCYNHNTDPNATFELDKVNQVMRHYALKDITAGTEILIDYGFDEENGEDWGDY